MKRLKRLLFAAALAVGLLGAASAQADINWHADWTPSDSSVVAGPKSNISFTNLANSLYTTTSALPVISTPVTNLTIVTTLGKGEHETFLPQNYKMSLLLTDDLSGNTHAFNFLGTLAGTISNSGASVVNVFDPLTKSQEFTFANGNHYKIDLNSYVPPGSGDNVNTKGAFGADITVTGNPDNGHVHDSPEPSTLALAGLGMAFTGLVAWRRRNRKVATA